MLHNHAALLITGNWVAVDEKEVEGGCGPLRLGNNHVATAIL